MDDQRSLEASEPSLEVGTSNQTVEYTTNPYAAGYQQVSSNDNRNFAGSSFGQDSRQGAALPATAEPSKSLDILNQSPSTFAFPLVRSIFGYDEATIDVLTWLQDSLLRVGFSRHDLNQVERQVWRRIQGLIMAKDYEALDCNRVLWVAIDKPADSPITVGLREPIFAVVKGFFKWQPWLDGQAKLARAEAYKQVVHSQTQDERSRPDRFPQRATSLLPQDSSGTSREIEQLQRTLPRGPAVYAPDADLGDDQTPVDARILESHEIANVVSGNANIRGEVRIGRQMPGTGPQHFDKFGPHQTKEQQQQVQNQIYAISQNDVIGPQSLNSGQQRQQMPEPLSQLLQPVFRTDITSHSATYIPAETAIPATSPSPGQTMRAEMPSGEADYLRQPPQLLRRQRQSSNLVSQNIQQVSPTQSSSTNKPAQTAGPHDRFYIYPAIKYASPNSLSRQNLQMAARFVVSHQQYAQCLRTAEYMHGKVMINLRGYLGHNDQTVSWTDMGITMNDKSFVVKHGKDRPINLSSFVVPGYNTLKVAMKRWPNRFGDKPYNIVVEMCPIFTREEVVDMVRHQHIDIDISKQQILKAIRPQVTDPSGSDSDDIQCLTSSYKLTLTCPLSMKRMKLPVRSVECRHATCFDLYNYLEFSRASWRCPICLGACIPPTLAVDEFVKWMIEHTSDNTQSVTIRADEQWTEDISAESPNVSDIVE
ncbi:hypothetical protein V1525DRAFT_394166 [Lipomyces kononenkoae]|uniref:Uncharacterized protein n=1 Tax=Lipomyces kononenkoae TaxID=34357 RepID=A0ACC3TB78_LIPKO